MGDRQVLEEVRHRFTKIIPRLLEPPSRAALEACNLVSLNRRCSRHLLAALIFIKFLPPEADNSGWSFGY